MTIRARVRPRALGRKPFIIKREFDMDELRATIPEPLPTLAGPRRLSADVPGMHTAAQGRRWSSTIHGPDAEGPPVRSSNTVPIRKSSRALIRLSSVF